MPVSIRSRVPGGYSYAVHDQSIFQELIVSY